MKILRYFEDKKQLYNILITYIENVDSNENHFSNLINFIQNQNILKYKEEFEHFLLLLLNIYRNYHRCKEMTLKIKRFLANFSKNIKNTFSNAEITKIFISDKQIFLFLLEINVITLDRFTIKYIMAKTEPNGIKYIFYFLLEMKEKLSNEHKKQIIEKYPTIVENYEEKRQAGENESYVCKLIREDSIKEFVKLMNQMKIDLFAPIENSVFETNSFLIENQPTLIEYAAFFGSIRIFMYLFKKYESEKNSLNPKIWLFAIHGKNAKIIHYLESENIKLPNDSYQPVFEEAIKCHHNSIACYLQNKNGFSCDDENIISCAFRSYNYLFFTEDFEKKSMFFYLYDNKYNEAVNFWLDAKRQEIETFIIFI